MVAVPSAIAAEKVDVSSEAQVEKAINKCIERFGGLHCVFANAGISGGLGSFMDVTEEELHEMWRVNLNGVFYCFKHGAKRMLEMKHVKHSECSLIATASVAGIRSGAGGAVYSASKAGVIGIVKNVANELTGTQIRVNCIAPGLIETGMTRPLFDLADAKNNRAKVGQLNPMLRYGVASEVATAAYFLANSEMSSYVNGQVLAVDGGLSSSHPVAFRKAGRPSM